MRTILAAIERATALVKSMTVAEKINNTGDHAAGVERLGLPPYEWWQEALHGVASSPGVNYSTTGDFNSSTSFPMPISLGATFNDDLVFNVASIISTEARAFNNVDRAGLDFWTPNINPFKDPRWGRGPGMVFSHPFPMSPSSNIVTKRLTSLGRRGSFGRHASFAILHCSPSARTGRPKELKVQEDCGNL